ncbi:TonB-dependent receptor [Aliiglaciecola sp. M165]|uniref:TonB-dependent receptor n=1 Tax=Aliiglaciecola sp. M165 TaxID=2593649 RepID=UPI00117C52E7|nr:TonB-dependent receptor [Aliiglaciecola sp. M165]TRY29756.1 TonB-dependent receptor [Aliiglaciecola sp. M165]
MTSRLCITCCCIVASHFTASALASAQTVDSIPDKIDHKVIERLTISSSRRDVDVHEVSGSVSVLSEKTLSENVIDDFQSALRLIPGVTLSQQRKNRATINIRGINTDIGETQLTQDPVGLYVNSMSITGPYAEILQPDLSLFDVNRVEVLRGPQGTLYGSGNIAGTVRIVTNQPNFDVLESAVRLDVADIAHGGVRHRQDLMINIPLISDELALRLVGSRRQADGWVKNTRLNIENDFTDSNLRAVLAWRPSENLDLSLEGMWVESDPGDANGWDPKQGKFLRSTFVRESRAFDLQIYNLNLAYQFANDLLLTSSTNKRSSTANWFDDLGDFFGFGQLVNQSVLDSDIFSQEFRFVSEHSERISWVAGAFYQEYKQQGPLLFKVLSLQETFADIAPGVVNSDVFNDGVFKTEVEELAVFVDAEVDLSHHWLLGLGARWFEADSILKQLEERVFDFESLALQQIPDFVNTTQNSDLVWRLSLSYQPDEQQHYYVTVSKGARAGKVNPNIGPSFVDPNDVVIEPDYGSDALFNLEVGTKRYWLDDQLQTNIAVYRIDWRDVQVDAIRPSDSANYIANAGDAEVFGIELELRANLEQISGFVNASWQDGKIVDISDQRSFLSGALKNDRLPGAAEFVASAGIDVTWQWQAGAQMIFSLNASYTDNSVNRFSNMSGVSAPNPDFAESEAFSQINSSISYLKGQWNVNLYVENLFDNDAIILNTGATNENPAISLRPRTLGLRVTYTM